MHALRTYRNAEGLTQKQLADEIGVTRTTLARWECGDRKIDPALVSVVAEKTKIPVQELRPDLFPAEAG